VNVVGNGSVSLNPAGGVYDAGTVVELTAVPASGWQFSGWSGDLSGAANPTSITMDGDKTVMATFTQAPVTQYTLTVNVVGNGSVSLNPAGGVYDAGTVVELTAVPASGWQFSGWDGDLSGTANPALITMDGDKTVTATFVQQPVGGGVVVYEETQSGGSTSSSSVATSGSLTGVSGDLYLAAIATKPDVGVQGVSGLGLAWSRVNAQCAGRDQTAVEVWMAQGTPSGNGSVSATLWDVPSNAVIAVSRYSGVDGTDPVGNLVSGNTNGVEGACSGGVDSGSYAFDLATTVDGAVVFGAVAMRHRDHFPGTGYTERVEYHLGSGGNVAGVATEDQVINLASAVTLDGTFDGNVDWAVVGLTIHP
jgi:uncharacterized repeat protein (TIGR02543 family)